MTRITSSSPGRRAVLLLLTLFTAACSRPGIEARHVSVSALAARAPIELPDAPGRVERRLKQLTGKGNGPDLCHEGDLADPSAPEQRPDGSIRITGTGATRTEDCRPEEATSAAVWADWWSFLRAEPPRREAMPLYRREADGGLVALDPSETAWDVTIERGADGEVLWAGVMTPPPGRRHAVMWDDNWTRRVWPFVRDAAGRWVREPEPLFGEAPDPAGPPSYRDHAYGHHFVTDEAGVRWVFYERVSETKDGRPWRTDLYARRMVSERRAADEEHFILGAGRPAMRRAVRDGGDALVEGPRPVRVELQGRTFYLLGFSAGDFRTASYGLHFAVSRHLLGPYRPYLSAAQDDFLDFGATIRAQYGLAWGPGRPVLFQDPNGAYWLLFHAMDERGHGPLRNVYLAPVELTLGADGWPVLSSFTRSGDPSTGVR